MRDWVTILIGDKVEFQDNKRVEQETVPKGSPKPLMLITLRVLKWKLPGPACKSEGGTYACAKKKQKRGKTIKERLLNTNVVSLRHLLNFERRGGALKKQEKGREGGCIPFWGETLKKN